METEKYSLSHRGSEEPGVLFGLPDHHVGARPGPQLVELLPGTARAQTKINFSRRNLRFLECQSRSLHGAGLSVTS
jgi:hypothetical protein